MTLNQDYINEINLFFVYIRTGKIDRLKELSPLRTYKERYPNLKLSGNSLEIKQLDTLVEFLNSFKSNPNQSEYSIDFLNGIFDEISLLLYGEKREYRKMPQVNQITGVSETYWSEFKILEIEFRRKGLLFLPEHTKTQKIQKYYETFPPLVFMDVITDKNKHQILKLDEIVDQLNILEHVSESDKLNFKRKLLNPENKKLVDEHDFMSCIIEARRLIFNGAGL